MSKTAALADNRFLDGLSPATRERLAACAKRESYADGGFVFREGDAPGYLYMLRSGQIDMIKSGDDGRWVVFATVEPGDYFGEIAVLDDTGRLTAARARGKAEVDALPCEDVRKALAAEPFAVTQRLFTRIFGYLRTTNALYLQEVVHKEKLQLVGEMSAATIHDFKNPLAGIRLAAEWIRQLHKDEMSLKACQVIVRQTERMVGMAQELLDFARGQLALKKERVVIGEHLEAFKQLNEEYLRQSRVILEVSADAAAVEADPGRLMRVFQNLVSNAVDAIGAKGGHVWLTVRRDGGNVEIFIKDDGPGIPEAARTRLFEPFFTYGKQHGTGLGMTIVKKIVTAHGGEISFETELGRGTTFRILLPACE